MTHGVAIPATACVDVPRGYIVPVGMAHMVVLEAVDVMVAVMNVVMMDVAGCEQAETQAACIVRRIAIAHGIAVIIHRGPHIVIAIANGGDPRGRVAVVVAPNPSITIVVTPAAVMTRDV